MKVEICNKSYTIEKKIDNLLSILVYIKENINQSLAFRSGCRSGVCGSCAVIVNGVEKLSCQTTIKDNDTITPLKNSKVIKDLVVDVSYQNKLLKKAKAQLQQKSIQITTHKDMQVIDRPSNCILCSSCYSICPVYSINNEFLSPFALVRAYRYVEDINEEKQKKIIDNIQQDGVFSCTLCGSCNMVCPSNIDIKDIIMKLQNKSIQYGYTNPNFDNFSNMDFGFNPNF